MVDSKDNKEDSGDNNRVDSVDNSSSEDDKDNSAVSNNSVDVEDNSVDNNSSEGVVDLEDGERSRYILIFHIFDKNLIKNLKI